MVANSSAEDEARVEKIRESIRIAAGDAVRSSRLLESAADEEAKIGDVTRTFFEIISLELKSQRDLRERLRVVEAELDFASSQVRRRDECTAKQQAELLREIQTANEVIRQWALRYSELAGSLKGGGGSGMDGTTGSLRSAAGASSRSFKRSTQQQDAVDGAASQSGVDASDPVPPNLVPSVSFAMSFQKLTDAKELEKKLDADRAAALADPEAKTEEQKLRDEMDRRVKDLQLKLQRENDMVVHRTVKKGEEALRSETAKLESKVRQLEQQLRRKEADAELQLQKERDRWRLQMQRAIDSAKSGTTAKLWAVVRELECARMETCDVAASAKAELDDRDQVISSLREQQRRESRQSVAGGSFLGASGDMCDTSALAATQNRLPSGTAKQSTRKSQVTLSLSSADFLSPSDAAIDDGTPTKSPMQLGMPTPPYPRKSTLSIAVSPSHGIVTPRSGGARRMSVSKRRTSVASSSSRGGSAADEVASLRDQLDAMKRSLTIATLARDEAVAERDILVEELSHADPELGAHVKKRLTVPAGSTPAAAPAHDPVKSAESLTAAVECDLKKLLDEFSTARNDLLLSMQTRVQRHVRRTHVIPSPLNEPESTGVAAIGSPGFSRAASVVVQQSSSGFSPDDLTPKLGAQHSSSQSSFGGGVLHGRSRPNSARWGRMGAAVPDIDVNILQVTQLSPLPRAQASFVRTARPPTASPTSPLNVVDAELQ